MVAAGWCLGVAWEYSNELQALCYVGTTSCPHFFLEQGNVGAEYDQNDTHMPPRNM